MSGIFQRTWSIRKFLNCFCFRRDPPPLGAVGRRHPAWSRVCVSLSLSLPMTSVTRMGGASYLGFGRIQEGRGGCLGRGSSQGWGGSSFWVVPF